MSQQLILTNKHLDLLALGLRKNVNVLVLEGTVRSTKTVIAIQLFYLRVKASKENLHCIAGKDYDSIRDNILDCNGFGLLTENFNDVQMKKDKIGSYYLTIKGLDGLEKKILLAGYANKEQWKKILGKTIATFLIDEANTANKTFIDETFARQLSVDYPLTIMTLNGDDPKHFIYQDYINYCKPLFKVPQSILDDMLPVLNKKGWYYTHWTFNDNPVMTPEKIERAKQTYPVSSYYYTIKILGERGIGSGLIYSIFVEHLKDYIIYDMANYKLANIVLGVDYGGNGSAHTFVATGYTVGMQQIIHIESERVDAKGMTADVLCDRFETFVNNIISKYHWIGRALECYCDNAEQTLMRQMEFRVKKDRLPVIIKNAFKKEINDRIEYQLLLFSRKILFFNSTAQSCIEAYRTARYSEKEGHRGERLDDGTTDIDTMDASEYTLTPFMRMIQMKLEVKK